MKSLILFSLSLLGLVACSSSNSKADQAVRNDFRRYLAQLSSVTDLEVQGNEANKKATSEPGANDATYAVALRDAIIPKFEEFARELGRIHPTTDEILGLHKILLKRARSELAGFKELEQSTRGGGEASIKKANDLIAEAGLYFRRWSDRMNELNKRYPGAK